MSAFGGCTSPRAWRFCSRAALPNQNLSRRSCKQLTLLHCVLGAALSPCTGIISFCARPQAWKTWDVAQINHHSLKCKQSFQLPSQEGKKKNPKCNCLGDVCLSLQANSSSGNQPWLAGGWGRGRTNPAPSPTSMLCACPCPRAGMEVQTTHQLLHDAHTRMLAESGNEKQTCIGVIFTNGPVCPVRNSICLWEGCPLGQVPGVTSPPIQLCCLPGCV